MEDNDKIFDQFKQAAGQMESKPFPTSEKVWSRVADQLDKKTLTKQHNLWKKTAIAASVLLVATLGYELFKPEPLPIAPQQTVVVSDPDQSPSSVPIQEPTALPKPIHPQFKPSADKFLREQTSRSPVVLSENPAADFPSSEQIEETETDAVMKSKKAAPTSRPARFQKGRAFESVGVQREETEHPAETKKEPQTAIVGNTQAPLVIVDGKAITGNEARKINSVSEGIAKIDPNDEKEIVILKEPLYIINGHYYSEAELFGPNPTSPYAPLNQQEIETIQVFQGQKAIANFGKRGEKGVVVIRTKDRKPTGKSK